MEGTPEAPGVNYRALRELFATKEDRGKDGMAYTIEISLLEIYCDEIRDLLTKEGGKKLEVKQTKAGTHVPNLTRLTVNSYEEVLVRRHALAPCACCVASAQVSTCT